MTLKTLLFAFSLIVVLALTFNAQETKKPENPAIGEAEFQTQPLRSILRRKNDVFVSNATGIFRAFLNERKWQRLDLPEEMPLGGDFARQPADSTVIFYTASKIYSDGDNGKTYGLYSSADDGETWRLVAEGDDFSLAFLHPNRSLFVVRNAGKFRGKAQILVSRDDGKNWRDITNNGFGEITSIFLDPDHPDLVCIMASSMRGYVLQSENESYHWKATRIWDWRGKRENEEEFFYRGLSTTSIAYVSEASIENYFSGNFAGWTFLPGFNIVPEKNSYTFSKSESKIIKVSIQFLSEPLSRTNSQVEASLIVQAKPEFVKLPVLKNSQGLWSAKIVKPDKTRLRLLPPVSKLIYDSKDRDKTKAELLEKHELEVWELNGSRSIGREIQLDELGDFSQPGTYKVQLQFENLWLDDKKQTDFWFGSFTGEVFTVTILPD